jgi:hypothetical protein
VDGPQEEERGGRAGHHLLRERCEFEKCEKQTSDVQQTYRRFEVKIHVLKGWKMKWSFRPRLTSCWRMQYDLLFDVSWALLY